MKFFVMVLISTWIVIISSLSVSTLPVFGGQSNSSIIYYENPFLGINFQHPDWWQKVSPSSFENNNCNLLGCTVVFKLNDNNKNTESYFSIRSYDHDIIKDECKCSNLIDFMKWKYESLVNMPGFLFIGDEELILPANQSAGMMDYLSLSNSEGFNYNYDGSIQYFDKFYDIRFESPSKAYFKQNIPEIKNVIGSIEFLDINPKQEVEQPSFLMQK